MQELFRMILLVCWVAESYLTRDKMMKQHKGILVLINKRQVL